MLTRRQRRRAEVLTCSQRDQRPLCELTFLFRLEFLIRIWCAHQDPVCTDLYDQEQEQGHGEFHDLYPDTTAPEQGQERAGKADHHPYRTRYQYGFQQVISRLLPCVRWFGSSSFTPIAYPKSCAIGRPASRPVPEISRITAGGSSAGNRRCVNMFRSPVKVVGVTLERTQAPFRGRDRK